MTWSRTSTCRFAASWSWPMRAGAQWPSTPTPDTRLPRGALVRQRVRPWHVAEAELGLVGPPDGDHHGHSTATFPMVGACGCGDCATGSVGVSTSRLRVQVGSICAQSSRIRSLPYSTFGRRPICETGRTRGAVRIAPDLTISSLLITFATLTGSWRAPSVVDTVLKDRPRRVHDSWPTRVRADPVRVIGGRRLGPRHAALHRRTHHLVSRVTSDGVMVNAIAPALVPGRDAAVDPDYPDEPECRFPLAALADLGRSPTRRSLSPPIPT
jgi:hypothetical protein